MGDRQESALKSWTPPSQEMKVSKYLQKMENLMNSMFRSAARNTVFTISPLLAIILLGCSIAITSNPVGAQTYTDLHDFDSSGPTYLDNSLIAQGRDGNFYTGSHEGGTSEIGTVFSVTPSGTVTILDSLDGTTGSYLYGGLILGTDGNFYGAPPLGGTSGAGTIFKVTSSGVLTVLYNFTNESDGGFPVYPPILGTDGNYYGVAAGNDEGQLFASTFYRITPSGVFTTLHTFSSTEGQACGGLVTEGSDGKFYGGCVYGGANNGGTLFKVSTSGTLTVLRALVAADGYNPVNARIVQAADGNFYGTMYQGGSDGAGVIFRISSSGNYRVLHDFTGDADGGNPAAGLTLANDGNIYGNTSAGGNTTACTGNPPGCGVFFKLTTAGAYSVIYTLDGTKGLNPQSNLTLDTSGVFYGITFSGGPYGQGVFYSLNTELAPFASLVSTAGKEGAKLGILGQGFNNSTVVKFNGVQATTVMRTGTTFLSATVPAGALTGAVTVTTGRTALTSLQTFKVTPTIASFSPPSGPVGTPVTITGTGLMQTTAVTFNGTSATFTVNSDTQVTATVPTGATTGRISIVTPGGTANSATSFTVN